MRLGLCGICLAVMLTNSTLASHGAGAARDDQPAQLMVIAESSFAQTLRNWTDGRVFAQARAESREPLEGVQGIRELSRHGVANPDLARALALDRTFVLTLRDGERAEALADSLATRPDLFEWVEIDRVGRAHQEEDTDSDSSNLPDDPYFPQQYNLHNSGQVVDGIPGFAGADIAALDAWEYSRGRSETVVAVFDSGISASHPDLAPKLVPGWNFVNDSADTDDPFTSHGTHCAGIISAITGNREGVAAVSWYTRLMPVVVLNKYGFGNESTVAEALMWAADQGVPVASVSLGFNSSGRDERVLRNAVEYATSQGMLICASSGNVASDEIGAPARFAETIAVGATDNRDRLWSGTSTGPEMDIAAPGVSIWSTWDSEWHDPGEDTYDARTGTSQACPHVAGVAALVLSIDPTLEPLEVMAILLETADDRGQLGWDERFGYGRLNAARAAHAAWDAKDGDDLDDDEVPCVADFNHDGEVRTNDFVLFLDAYAAESWRADIAAPRGVVDTLDVLAFIQAFIAGCDERDLSTTIPD